LDLLDEIGKKRLVKSKVVVAGGGLSGKNSFAENYLTLSTPPDFVDDYRPPLDVMFGQSLGLFFSLQWNLRPDCPSPNGAISRVVQNVSIHS
jgi:tagatose-6-phosphate ketose/aldose isomerase